MSLALWHWHIGITSKCTLRCPRCIRTEFPNTVSNNELSLDFFKKHFTESFIKDHVERITFCGNDGDPIYANDLIDIIKYFKSIKEVSFTIITNGSHKKNKFWIELGKVLNDNDQIHFSIDGFDNESNNIYRINSDYNSIINGAKILRRISDVYMSWSTILFKFNENHIEQMIETARKIGFDVFQLTQSTKFGKYNNSYPKDDPLQPSDNYLINHGMYERQLTVLNNRRYKEPYKSFNIEHYQQTNDIGDVFPLCHTGLKGIYIDSDGYFYPCCWVANKYEHNKVWDKRRINLDKTTLIEAVTNEFWNEKFIDDSQECIHKCDKKFRLTTYNTRE